MSKVRIQRWFLGLAMALLLSACQREIELDLPDYQSKLVIEGVIETGSPAVVMLSKSIPYFSEINLETLMSQVLVNGTQAREFFFNKVYLPRRAAATT